MAGPKSPDAGVSDGSRYVSRSPGLSFIDRTPGTLGNLTTSSDEGPINSMAPFSSALVRVKKSLRRSLLAPTRINRMINPPPPVASDASDRIPKIHVLKLVENASCCTFTTLVGANRLINTSVKPKTPAKKRSM